MLTKNSVAYKEVSEFKIVIPDFDEAVYNKMQQPEIKELYNDVYFFSSCELRPARDGQPKESNIFIEQRL